jgi:hypothetical protein
MEVYHFPTRHCKVWPCINREQWNKKKKINKATQITAKTEWKGPDNIPWMYPHKDTPKAVLTLPRIFYFFILLLCFRHVSKCTQCSIVISVSNVPFPGLYKGTLLGTNWQRRTVYNCAWTQLTLLCDLWTSLAESFLRHPSLQPRFISEFTLCDRVVIIQYELF